MAGWANAELVDECLVGGRTDDCVVDECWIIGLVDAWITGWTNAGLVDRCWAGGRMEDCVVDECWTGGQMLGWWTDGRLCGGRMLDTGGQDVRVDE